MLNIKSMNNEVLGLKIGRNDQLERPIFYQTGPTEKSGLPRKMDCFFRTFPVGANRFIQFWTEISGNSG